MPSKRSQPRGGDTRGGVDVVIAIGCRVEDLGRNDSILAVILGKSPLILFVYVAHEMMLAIKISLLKETSFLKPNQCWDLSIWNQLVRCTLLLTGYFVFKIKSNTSVNLCSCTCCDSVIRMNNIRGDLTDISDKAQSLLLGLQKTRWWQQCVSPSRSEMNNFSPEKCDCRDFKLCLKRMLWRHDPATRIESAYVSDHL